MVGIIGCILFLVLELAMVAKYVGTSTKLASVLEVMDTFASNTLFRLTYCEVFALFGYIVFYSGQVLSFDPP